MSARARHLSLLLAVLLAIATPFAVAVASSPDPSPSTYRVKSGDTITSIAVQLRLPGGWEQLYKANQDRIGTDPNRLTVGTDLAVPQGAAVPAGEGYVVRAGDTLNSIADRLHVTGGGNALYAANRNAIGPDPNRLEVGQTLLPPGAAPQTTATQPPKASVPPAALNHPAAPAPIAAGSSTQASHSGNNTAVLWSVLAGLLFVLFVVLVLFALPRWRRGSSQEVWVGGSYNAGNQPMGPAKNDRPQQKAERQPEPEPQFERQPQPDPQQQFERQPQPEQRPVTAAWADDDEPQAVRLIEPGTRARSKPAPLELNEIEQKVYGQKADRLREPTRPQQAPPVTQGPRPPVAPETAPRDRGTQESAPTPDVRSVVAGLQPGSVGGPAPRRQGARSLFSYALSGLRNDRTRSAGPRERDLADELLGEVRIVDRSIPLTKDRS